jgi:hypothetical protein
VLEKQHTQRTEEHTAPTTFKPRPQTDFLPSAPPNTPGRTDRPHRNPHAVTAAASLCAPQPPPADSLSHRHLGPARVGPACHSPTETARGRAQPSQLLAAAADLRPCLAQLRPLSLSSHANRAPIHSPRERRSVATAAAATADLHRCPLPRPPPCRIPSSDGDPAGCGGREGRMGSTSGFVIRWINFFTMVSRSASARLSSPPSPSPPLLPPPPSFLPRIRISGVARLLDYFLEHL